MCFRAAWSTLEGVDLGPCNNAWTLIKIGPDWSSIIYHSFNLLCGWGWDVGPLGMSPIRGGSLGKGT